MNRARRGRVAGRKWLRRCGLGLVFLTGILLAGWLVMLALMMRWVAHEPELKGNVVLPEGLHTNAAGRVTWGRNWREDRPGLHVLYLTGSAFEMGYANGRLTQDLIHGQEEAVLSLVGRVASGRVMRFVLEFAVVYRNRHLASYVSPELQQEMLGLSRGCPDVHPELGPEFNRVVSFHAAQDISYMMMHSRWAVAGCTAFGAWGASTREGHLLAGRNFDWEADPIFDRERVVILCEPDEGIPFLSLAWAGMAGCVTGMNREGLYISVNGGPSELPAEVATPTCLVAREVLQRASNLAEAASILRSRSIFVSAVFLLGSRRDGRFVVVEKTPLQTVIREAEDRPWIICPNHYLSSELRGLKVNQEALVNDTSGPRYERAVELLSAATAPLDPVDCAGVLRDRCLPGGRFPGNGHRSTLNPLIATHAAVVDVSAGVFWAAASPHQLGRLVAFDVSDFGRVWVDGDLPEDSMLLNGEFERYRNSLAEMEAAREALGSGDLEGALKKAQAAVDDNPGGYRAVWLLAEVLRESGRPAAALEAARKVEAAEPALGRERRDLARFIRNLGEGEKGIDRRSDAATRDEAK